MIGTIGIISIFVFVMLLFLGMVYNQMVTLRNRIDNSFSQIDVQLKKRADLVPNLVETVKGYMKHEKTTFENITKARSAILSANTVKEKAAAENMMAGALKTLFAVSENYPKLKANENFMMLQEELSGIENKIAYARQFYNDSVVAYNTKIQTVPTNIVAGIFSFKERDYFEIKEAEKKPVKVKF